MNILCIGNSFSQDATHYLHQLSRFAKTAIDVTNLHIGGCSLERHFRNMCRNNKEYELDINGTLTSFTVTLKEALLNKSWDYITLQQASALSVNYEYYQPYLSELVKYIRSMCPGAKLVIHETWAYEEGNRGLALNNIENSDVMYERLHGAYLQAAKDINADAYIPSGTLCHTLIKKGVSPLHRDGQHISLGVGRYALALLWYRILTGEDIRNIEFRDFDEPVPEEYIRTVKETIEEII